MSNCSKCFYFQSDPCWCGFYEEPVDENDERAQYCIEYTETEDEPDVQR